ncbi:amino acid adenylation domain-containing protein [Paenibacillus thiaminolyticus]|uniref:non-ribosomal peptide synthetase n=1 Tax=Paenibacillus thiaminolyticus TaxID=49283 RepID=UPI00232BE646|nr:non-ribosomal peptide synthetase [Paenibacillus thiaminolyticus]WCF06624.1 amino acid adenylation domain-containing protein [Paenibacillus thiaminolyticus]
MDRFTLNILLSSGELDKPKEYWTQKFKSGYSMTAFPSQRPKQVSSDSKMMKRAIVFPSELTEALERVGGSSSYAKYLIVLAGSIKLLSVYSRESLLSVGSPLAKYTNGEKFDWNDVFPIQTDLSASHTFKELLLSVKNSAEEAEEHKALPFSMTLDLIGEARQAQEPLFGTVLTMDTLHGSPSLDTSQALLLLHLQERIGEQEIILEATCSSEDYEDSFVERLLQHLVNGLTWALHHPVTPLSKMEMMNEEETQGLFTIAGNPKDRYPYKETIVSVFERRADQFPGHTAVTFQDKHITYQELEERSNQLAHYLYETHSVGPDCLVGIMMDRSEWIPIAIMGVLKAGGAYVPIDPDYPQDRIEMMVKDSEISVIISMRNCIASLNHLLWSCPSLHAYVCLDSENVMEEREWNENGLMSKELWEHIGAEAEDDIAGGAWVSSYTRENLSREEMDEYGDNIVHKLLPKVHKNTRVLEIGCASGISMFRLAPHVGFYYGTDLSATIIKKNQQYVLERGINNIRLDCFPAHHIHNINENDFDIVIMNSVIQAFHGHNYLRQVILKAISLMKKEGVMFLGDIMDLDKKEELLESLRQYKREHPQAKTKTEFHDELFLSRDFFTELQHELKEIASIEFSEKIYTIENELTRYRYDVIITINKENEKKRSPSLKKKHQHGFDRIKHLSYSRLTVQSQAPENLAYVIYTSGSTGVPKGVMVEHRNVVRLFFNEHNRFEFSENDTWTMFHSFCFDFSVWELFGALLFGGRVVIVPKLLAQHPPGFAEMIRSEKVTVLNQTPASFYRVIESNEGELDYSSLRYVIFGGEALNASRLLPWHMKWPDVQLINMYGITETTVHVTYHRLTRKEMTSGSNTIGRPLPTLAVYVADEDGNLLPQGMIGELYVSGPGVARGYLNRPELTAERFIPNPFVPGERIYKSGDLVRWLPDGILEYFGRKDHQVKIRGYRIELGEIEAALSQHEGVKHALVLELKEDEDISYLCAYLILADDKLTISDLKEHLHARLPNYMVPAKFAVVPAFPLTNNGKIDRTALMLQETQLELGVSFVEPRNDTEARLASIWRDILKKDRIGAVDNFFDLGGHSLKAASLISRIHQVFGVSISLRKVFELPTLEKLSEFILLSEQDRLAPIPNCQTVDYYPLSASQQRLFILHQLKAAGNGYNMPAFFKLEGSLDMERLHQAFHLLIQRHESLRTSFGIVDQEPVQYIDPSCAFAITTETVNPDQLEAKMRQFTVPFHLEQAPLLRAHVLKVSNDEHYLLLDMHHIITDGASLEIMVNDFLQLYEGHVLPPLRIQYKDFAVWQQTRLAEMDMLREEMYWLERFEGNLPVLSLPTDYERPALFDFHGSRHAFTISTELTEQIQQLTKEKECTLYMFLLAAFSILLSKYSGQEDIVIGTPVSGRIHPDVESVVGMFVNTLPMRTYPSIRKSFDQFLEEIKEDTLRSFEHQSYSLDKLVDKLGLVRDLSRNPLFSVMLNVLDFNTEIRSLGELTLTNLTLDSGVSKFDITLQVTEENGFIACEMEYASSLFRKETIEKMANHFIQLLASILSGSRLTLGELEMISADEVHEILQKGQGKRLAPLPKQTLADRLRKQAQCTPDRPALLYGDETMTYRELDDASGRVAHDLIQAGCQGQAVALLMERSAEMVIAILGIVKAGAAFVPIDPAFPEKRVQYMLADCGARLMLTDASNQDMAVRLWGEQVAVWGPNLKTPPSLPERAALPALPEGLAYILYTSGSTGQPKGVLVKHPSILNTLRGLHERYPMGPQDVYLFKTAYTFDVSLSELWGWMWGGGALAILEPGGEKNPAALAAAVQRYGVTHINFVPPMLSALIHGLDEEGIKALQGLRYIFAAGEALPGALAREVVKKLPEVRLENLYGPTEVSIYATGYSVTGTEEGGIPIGRPLPNVHVYIMDEGGALQPIGVPGELYVGGAGVAAGYVNREAQTAERFMVDPYVEGGRMYRTGDIARWNREGQVEYLGRTDDQVKIRGYRIELGEVEKQLLETGLVREAVVVSKTDPAGLPYLCAYVTAQEPLKTEEVRAELGTRVPSYMVPGHIIRLETIPLNSSGKADRRALADLSIEWHEHSTSYEAPRTGTERKLAALWSEILGIQEDEIGIHDSFFDLGGHSLNATILSSRISKMYEVNFTLESFINQPYIAEMATTVEQLERGGVAAIQPVQKKERYPLSAAQRRMLFIHQQAPDDISYNMSGVFEMKGHVDVKRLEQALLLLTERHEILRTSFHLHEGEYTQVIHPDPAIHFEFLQSNDQPAEFVRSFIRPFHLGHTPLFRTLIVEQSENEYLFLFDMHHIIGDGFSMPILVEDLLRLYKGEQLAPIQLHYKDIAAWEEDRLNSGTLSDQETYWIEKMSGQLPELHLPLDYPAQNKHQTSGGTERLKLEPALSSEIKELCKSENCTLFMFMLTAYYILLHKWTGQKDMIIGTPIAGRTHPDMEKIPGLFVNTLAMRLTVQPEHTFQRLLAGVRELCLDAYRNQDYPFDKLVDRLSEVHQKKVLLFQTMFQLETSFLGKDITDFEVTPLPFDGVSSKFKLTFSVEDTQDELSLRIKYDKDAFKSSTIRRLLEQYSELLTLILNERDILIEDLNLSTTANELVLANIEDVDFTF